MTVLSRLKSRVQRLLTPNWRCSACGKTYRRNPHRCSNCGHTIFERP